MLRDKLDDRAGARHGARSRTHARSAQPRRRARARRAARAGGAHADARRRPPRACARSIAQSPRRCQLYERLAQVNAWQADVDARWVALAAVEALGDAVGRSAAGARAGPPAAVGVRRSVKLDEASRKLLRGALGGPLLDLWRAIAPAVQVATGVDAGKLGFARGDKLAIKKLGDKYEPLATALACFGVDDVEIYISASRTASRARSPARRRSCASARTSPPRRRHSSASCSAAPSRRSPRASPALARSARGRARRGRSPRRCARSSCRSRRRSPSSSSGEDDQHRRAREAAEEGAVAARRRASSRSSRRAAATLGGYRRRSGARALAVGHRAGLLWAGDLAVALAVLDVGKGGRQLTDSPRGARRSSRGRCPSRSSQAARASSASRSREPLAMADKPKGPQKPFLGEAELASELDAWDDMFDALHETRGRRRPPRSRWRGRHRRRSPRRRGCRNRRSRSPTEPHGRATSRRSRPAAAMTTRSRRS